MIGVAVAEFTSADRVTPPLLDVHDAVYLEIADPWSGGVVYDTMSGPVVADVVDPGWADTAPGPPGSAANSASWLW